MKRQQSCTPNTGNGGNYYGYGAATAGDTKTTVHEAINSVCPKAWVIPKYESSKSFHNLGNKIYKSAPEQVILYPISILRTGNYYGNNGTFHDREKIGYYYTNKTGELIARYVTQFGKDNIDYNYSNRFAYGFSLRCVAR